MITTGSNTLIMANSLGVSAKTKQMKKKRTIKLKNGEEERVKHPMSMDILLLASSTSHTRKSLDLVVDIWTDRGPGDLVVDIWTDRGRKRKRQTGELGETEGEAARAMHHTHPGKAYVEPWAEEG